jgi:hypothetical protein
MKYTVLPTTSFQIYLTIFLSTNLKHPHRKPVGVES